MDPQLQAMILNLIAQSQGLAGKPGAQLTAGDVSRGFAPELGVMTGTYTGREDPVESEADIYTRLAPTYLQVSQTAGQDKYLDGILADLDAGIPLLKVKQNLRTLLKEDGYGTADKQSKANAQFTKDYEDQIDILYKEKNSVNQELVKIKNAPAKKTIFSEAGLPEPDAPYDAEPFMGGVYAKLLERAKPYERTPEQNREKAYQESTKGFDQSKFALEQQFQREALSRMGGSKDPSSLRFVYERAMANPEFAKKDRARFEQAKKYLDDSAKSLMKASPEYEAIAADERDVERNRDRFAKSKTYVPVRTELVNKQREEEVRGDAQAIKERLARQMQRRGAGSPLLDQLQQRLILQKVMENPSILSKLKTPGT